MPADKEAGTYSLAVRLADGGKTFGKFSIPFLIGDMIRLSMDTVPMTKKTQPAVRVLVRNFTDREVKGTVTLVNRNFAEGERPVDMTKDCTVPAAGETSVLFPMPPEQIRISWDYPFEASFREAGGKKDFSCAEDLSFRAVEHTPGPIVIDGDLSDWKLADRTAVPFIRAHTSYDSKKGWKGPADLSCDLYTLWDENGLYFAADIKDDFAITRYNNVDIWVDDNIMWGLYPDGLKRGDTVKGGYYREHIGPCQDGVARIFRVGNPENGPATAENAKIAIKRTKDGYLYEWFYPWSAVAPLSGRPGEKFRLSALVFDRDKVPAGIADDGFKGLTGISLRGFCENVDSRPEKWAEFVLIPEGK